MVTAAADTFVDSRYRGVFERPGHAQSRAAIACHLIAPTRTPRTRSSTPTDTAVASAHPQNPRPRAPTEGQLTAWGSLRI